MLMNDNRKVKKGANYMKIVGSFIPLHSVEGRRSVHYRQNSGRRMLTISSDKI